MADNNFFGVKKGVRFRPSTLPATGNTGEVTFDSASSTLKYWNGAAWADLYPTTSTADNYIINSNFKVWQRTTAAVTGLTSGSSYHADRFSWAAGTITGVVKSEQVAASVFTGSATLPKNCQTAVRYEVTTAQAVLGAAATAGPWHLLEGYDWENMLANGGLSNGVTLSFYVASSVTGTYTVEFSSTASDQRYATTYSIGVANTWQRVSIFLSSSAVTTGIGSGTWDYVNGIGLRMRWWLAAGSTSNGATQNAWTGATANIPAAQVNWLGTLANRFGITGLMFNIGPVANYAPRGKTITDELQLCRRYYEKTYDINTAVGTATGNGQLVGFGCAPYATVLSVARASSAPFWNVYQASTQTLVTGGTLQVDGTGKLNNGSVQVTIDPTTGLNASNSTSATNHVWIQMQYKVTKRAVPTVTTYNTNTGASGTMYNSAGAVSTAASSGGQDGVYITNGGNSARLGTDYTVHVTADSEL